MMFSIKQKNTSCFRFKRKNSIILWVGLVVFIFCVMIPFYWMAKAAVSSPEELVKIPPVYLPKVTFENFKVLSQQVPLLRYVLNSVTFAGISTIITVIICFLAAYAFARIPFPGSNILLLVLVLSMALPEVATIIPLYRMLGAMKLLDSLTGLIIVMSSALAPFTVWVFVPFIQQVPIAIEEAAIIDGASLPTILRKVYLPICAPSVVTMLIINFVNAWNNLLYPLSFSVTDRSRCLSVAITEVFRAQVPWGKPWNLVSALGLTMVIPVIIMILFSQRAIVSGLTRGAVK